MKTFFAYERNAMGKYQPVKFHGHVTTKSSGGHDTEKVQIRELPEDMKNYSLEVLTTIYPYQGAY